MMRIILLLLLTVIGATAAVDAPVSTNASPRARALLIWLGEKQGKQILSGLEEDTPEPFGTNSPEKEFERLQKLTGKIPAVRSFDLRPVSPVQYSGGKVPSLAVTDRAIQWWKNNGLVAFQWSWMMTNRSGGWDVMVKNFEQDGVRWQGFDLDHGLAPETPEYGELLAGIDAAAVELVRLRDAGVPVLWRPLHEGSGGWFWWGAKGPEQFKMLWKLMFKRMTEKHHLNNLLWVFNPSRADALEEWYPGDDFVDVISLNCFPNNGEHPSFKEDYEALARFRGGKKVLAMSECGGLPDPDLLMKEKAGWAYFCLGTGKYILDDKVNPTNLIQKVFTHPYVINRGDLPRLEELPAH